MFFSRQIFFKLFIFTQIHKSGCIVCSKKKNIYMKFWLHKHNRSIRFAISTVKNTFSVSVLLLFHLFNAFNHTFCNYQFRKSIHYLINFRMSSGRSPWINAKLFDTTLHFKSAFRFKITKLFWLRTFFD